MDDAGAGHRLDHGADGLVVNLIDPMCEGPWRGDVGWDGELVEVLALAGEQADVNFPSTQV